MTITGGPGWVVDAPGAAAGRDVSGAERRPARPRLQFGLALAAAFVVGFAAPHVLSGERRASVSGSAEGQLSLAVDVPSGPDYVTDADGRLAVQLSLVVRNTGPADVVLESAGAGELEADGVQGRNVRADGRTRVSLVRAVDCARLPPAAEPVGPLVVRARTAGGTRETRLPLEDGPGSRFAQRLREACGQVPPEAALDLGVEVVTLDGDAARLPLELRNTSARDVVVTDVQPREGLLLELLDAGGAPVVLPLRLPAAEYPTPRPPDELATSSPTRLVAVLRRTSCDALPEDGGATDRPLLELSVADGDAAAPVPFGVGARLLQRLTETACPGQAAAG